MALISNLGTGSFKNFDLTSSAYRGCHYYYDIYRFGYMACRDAMKCWDKAYSGTTRCDCEFEFSPHEELYTRQLLRRSDN